MNSTLCSTSEAAEVSSRSISATTQHVNSESTSPWTALNISTLILGLIGFFGNLFVCIVFVFHKPLRKRLPNYFLLNQSVLDLVAGLILIIFIIMAVNPLPDALLPTTCILIKSRLIFLAIFMASIWNLAALSFERYAEICHPIRHKLSLTKTKVIVTCVTVWIFGVISKCLVIIPVVRFINGACVSGIYVSILARRISGIYIFTTEFVIPLCIIAFCYIAMARAVRKITNAPSSGNDSRIQMIQARKNIVKLLAIISVFFVLTVAPRHFIVLSSTLGWQYLDPNGLLFSTCLAVNYSNCCINPLIYMFKYEEFQKGTRALLGINKLKKSAEVIAADSGLSNTKRMDVNGLPQSTGGL